LRLTVLTRPITPHAADARSLQSTRVAISAPPGSTDAALAAKAATAAVSIVFADEVDPVAAAQRCLRSVTGCLPVAMSTLSRARAEALSRFFRRLRPRPVRGALASGALSGLKSMFLGHIRVAAATFGLLRGPAGRRHRPSTHANRDPRREPGLSAFPGCLAGSGGFALIPPFLRGLWQDLRQHLAAGYLGNHRARDQISAVYPHRGHHLHLNE